MKPINNLEVGKLKVKVIHLTMNVHQNTGEEWGELELDDPVAVERDVLKPEEEGGMTKQDPRTNLNMARDMDGGNLCVVVLLIVVCIRLDLHMAAGRHPVASREKVDLNEYLNLHGFGFTEIEGLRECIRTKHV